jgi:primase-polymerase (primpol)-like protein
MIKETPAVDQPITRNIPEALTERPQWVCWRHEERDEKLTKVPFAPHTGSYASSTDLMTWTTFEDTLAAYRASEGFYDGIGFVFSSADPFVGIDLDDCRDPATGEISPWAKKILERVQKGYVEISPSGTGIHIIVRGAVRDGRTRKKVRLEGEVIGEIEMYGRGRFFTVTGEPL